MFETWYASEITGQLDNGCDIYGVEVPLKLSVMKPIHTNWIIGLYDYLRNKTEIICKGRNKRSLNSQIGGFAALD